ncbi:hypothetical protein JTE90_010819 [Oedothorax gibbosus]|uniref:Uncharacterized protein n=1 Tax=Oedothorax gibbosus TaxID=931172 RepID=A0AAV6V4X1_9ARAC|nr:hypothetical protein JTE90_010819 [Oedothorax gibbosus]
MINAVLSNQPSQNSSQDQLNKRPYLYPEKECTLHWAIISQHARGFKDLVATQCSDPESLSKRTAVSEVSRPLLNLNKAKRSFMAHLEKRGTSINEPS